jgi:hypothetical protein
MAPLPSWPRSSPAAGLEFLDALTDEPSLKGYHVLASVPAICSQSWVVSTRRRRSAGAPRR